MTVQKWVTKPNQDYARTAIMVHTCNLSYLEGRDQKD
jgi:hypothetical protein